MVKNLPVMQETEETQVQSMGQEDPLEEEMATHCSIVAWRILWSQEPGELHSQVTQSRIQLKRLSMHVTDFFLFFSRRGALCSPPHPGFSSVASHSS